MSGLLELFLTPAAERAPEDVAERGGRGRAEARSRPPSNPGAPAPSAVVLGASGEAAPVARLLAAHLRQRARAGCALLAEWRAEEPEPPHGAMEAHPPRDSDGRGSAAPSPVGSPRGASAARPARALAESLRSRGLEAVARGRLAGVALAAEPEVAALEWRRATVAAGCPSVCALGGPRPAAFAALLDDADLVVVVLGGAAPPELEQLALGLLAGVSAPVVGTAPVSSGLSRILSSSSLATARALGADLTGVVRSL